MRLLACVLACVLAASAQELRRAASLEVSKGNVLAVERESSSVVTNAVVVGRRAVFTVETNAVVVVRQFPMMTDILQRSQARRLQEEAAVGGDWRREAGKGEAGRVSQRRRDSGSLVTMISALGQGWSSHQKM